MLSALIVDDEELARDVITHMLVKHPSIKVTGECSNGIAALEAIKAESPNIVFLDIKMPGLDGVKLVESIPSHLMPILVFVTAYDQYALKAFELNAIDYLLKPFDQNRFDQTIERALKRYRGDSEAELARKFKKFLSANELLGDDIRSQEPDSAPETKHLERIVVKEGGRVFFVSTEDVDCFEASGNYVALSLGKKTNLVYETLSKMEKKLDPETFIRIHRSSIVNVKKIKELQPHFNGEYIVVLQSGKRLKLSRSYRGRAKRLLGME